MKISKNQLRSIIKEEIAVLTKDSIKDVVMDILSDEGGAAGIEPIQKALSDLENDDISLPEEPIEDIIGDVPGVKRHKDGDFVDTTKLESIASLRSLIGDLLTESSDQIVCPNCGHINDGSVDKCAKCGHSRQKGHWKRLESYEVKIGKKVMGNRIQHINVSVTAMDRDDAKEKALQHPEALRGKYNLAILAAPGDLDMYENKNHKVEVLQLSEVTLRNLIREAMQRIDVVDRETGEVLVFGRPGKEAAPAKAWPDLVKRLGLQPEDNGPDNAGDQSFTLSRQEFDKLEQEVIGKQDRRFNKKRADAAMADRERLDINKLLQKLRYWAEDAARDYMADTEGDVDLQDIAYDLADSAEYAFEEDEWEELLWHFDGDRNKLKIYTAESMG